MIRAGTTRHLTDGSDLGIPSQLDPPPAGTSPHLSSPRPRPRATISIDHLVDCFAGHKCPAVRKRFRPVRKLHLREQLDTHSKRRSDWSAARRHDIAADACRWPPTHVGAQRTGSSGKPCSGNRTAVDLLPTDLQRMVLGRIGRSQDDIARIVAAADFCTAFRSRANMVNTSTRNG